jgi:hypothetical protein
MGKLTGEQKTELAELTNRYNAKIAERETFLKSKIKSAEASGAFDEAGQLREQMTRDLSVLREELETKKARIWSKTE